MANISLEPKALLGGFNKDFGGVSVAEVTDLALVSLAVPQGDEDTCAKNLKAAYGVAMPDNGRYVTSSDGKTRIARTMADQMMVMFTHDAPDAMAVVNKATAGSFWTTDQTDVWCALEISGAQSRDVLARICPLDLHEDVFGPDGAARTTMEHMGAMIVRTGDDSFLLMSARSSAPSFLHAVETSAKYVL